MLQVGQPAPTFSLPDASMEMMDLASWRGKKNVVLYFYPKDSTPGCTTEAQQFRDLHAQFRATGAEIFGISRDSLKSHENFKVKLDLPFDLLSDPDEAACNLFGVIRLKNLYGKQVRGIERSTFVIDAAGVLRRVLRQTGDSVGIGEMPDAAAASCGATLPSEIALSGVTSLTAADIVG